MIYYIEVGTCDFDTLTQEYMNNNDVFGIALEPITQCFNLLPKRKNTFYENSALITSNKAEIDFYTIDNDRLLSHPDNYWLRAISSANKNHPDVVHNKKLLWDSYKKIKVKSINFKNLLKKYNFYYQCDIIKLDTEGMDGELLLDIYKYYEENNPELFPKQILFENKHLNDQIKQEIANTFKNKYTMKIKGIDVELNLILN